MNAYNIVGNQMDTILNGLKTDGGEILLTTCENCGNKVTHVVNVGDEAWCEECNCRLEANRLCAHND